MMNNVVCIKNGFVSDISSTGHMTQLSLISVDEILDMFVCIFVISLECFCSKIGNAITLQSILPGFLAHSVDLYMPSSVESSRSIT